MGNEKGGGSFEEFVGLKPGMNWFVDDSSEHEKVKGMNKNAVYNKTHDVYKRFYFIRFSSCLLELIMIYWTFIM